MNLVAFIILSGWGGAPSPFLELFYGLSALIGWTFGVATAIGVRWIRIPAMIFLAVGSFFALDIIGMVSGVFYYGAVAFIIFLLNITAIIYFLKFWNKK
jgi:hypothetical protein